MERLERGLQEAGISLRESKFVLKEEDPKKWRQYLPGVWRRHQDCPKMAALYQRRLMIARRLLQQWTDTCPALKLPVTFDNWYTQPAFCRFVGGEPGLPYVGTLAEDDQVILKEGRLTLGEFAQRLRKEHLRAIQAGDEPVFRILAAVCR